MNHIAHTRNGKRNSSISTVDPIKKQAVSLPQFDFQGLPAALGSDNSQKGALITHSKEVHTKSHSRNHIAGQSTLVETSSQPAVPFSEDPFNTFQVIQHTKRYNNTQNNHNNQNKHNSYKQKPSVTSQKRNRTQTSESHHDHSRNVQDGLLQTNTKKRFKVLNRELIEGCAMTQDPSEVLELFLSDKKIFDIDESIVEEYKNLYLLELGDNWKVPLWKLGNLQLLKELHVPCNSLDYVFFQDPNNVIVENDGITVHMNHHDSQNFTTQNGYYSNINDSNSQINYGNEEKQATQEGKNTLESHGHERNINKSTNQYFPALETLNLSFNNLHVDVFGLFYQLSLLPSLKRLNLSSNDLETLPEDLSNLKNLIFLSLEGNNLNERVFNSLKTLPCLEKLNLSRNRIRRIPQIQQKDQNQDYTDDETQIFPALSMLNLGENLITYHQDLYNLRHFSVLNQIFIWGNPISDSSKELENAAGDLEEKNIQIILNGPVPPQTKDLSVKNFYSHKMKSLKSYEYVTRKVAPKRSNSAIQSEGSGFFITETRTIESDNHSESLFDTARDTNGSISIKSEGQPSSRINVLQPKSSPLPTSNPDMKYKSKYDYNADWFKLDSALQSLSIDQDDPFYMPGHSMSMRVEKQLSNSKGGFRDLKFALDHPLKTVDEKYIQQKFSSTKNPRFQRKEEREKIVDHFYQSSK